MKSIPKMIQESVLGCVKAPGLRFPQVGLYLKHKIHLRELNRGSFHAPQDRFLNHFRYTLIALLFFTSTLSALEDDFSSDNLIIGTDNISVISVFDTMTFITTYSSTGDPLWEAPFTSEVISWKRKEDHLLVFSKARNGIAYFLTCIDAKEGVLVWERRVLSPEFEG